MPLRLRAAVHGEVLRRGNHPEVVGIVSLQTLHEGDAQTAGEERVLSVSLLPASPARIAKDVDVRRPDGQSVVDRVNIVANGLVVLGAGLDGDRRGLASHQSGVPRRRHSYRLWKQSGVSDRKST